MIHQRSFLLFAAVLVCFQTRGLAVDKVADRKTLPATIRTILTTKDTGARLTEQPVTPIGQSADGSLPSVHTNAYFDAPAGLGYTLCRTPINSCDFFGSNSRPTAQVQSQKSEHRHLNNPARSCYSPLFA